MDHILALHRDLKYGHGVSIFRYKHGGYKAFKIFDPRPRDIHRAPVRDRLLHHALYGKFFASIDQRILLDLHPSKVFI